ncbi:MAG: hypothetical protein K5868_08245 [Lachnospiraceae bacterium]|nr:hypothetical protein [Lachnospiraceae bacterium]
MSGSNSKAPELNKLQIKADIVLAENALKEAKSSTPKLAKYLKGQVGYHLQQAAEKLIKIQIYKSGKSIDYSKLYKHDIQYIINYAKSKGISLMIPDYVAKNSMVISSWEAEGRYDVHIVVKYPQLEKAYSVISEWYQQLEKSL